MTMRKVCSTCKYITNNYHEGPCVKCIEEGEGKFPFYEPDEQETDAVKEPEHYKHGEFECIDEMVLVFGRQATIDFCRLNAWKYRYRAHVKGNMKEDLEKADEYIKFAYELQEKPKLLKRKEEPERNTWQTVWPGEPTIVPLSDRVSVTYDGNMSSITNEPKNKVTCEPSIAFKEE